MSNSKKSEIGTGKYFTEISKSTIFNGVNAAGSAPFAGRVKEISKNAAQSLRQLYDDLEKNQAAVCFLGRMEIQAIEALAHNLHKTAKLMNASTTKTSSDIASLIKKSTLPSKYRMREVEEMAKILEKNRLDKLSGSQRKSKMKNMPLKNKSDELVDFALKYIVAKKGKAVGRNRFEIGGDKYIRWFDGVVFPWVKFTKKVEDYTKIKEDTLYLIKKIEDDLKRKHKTCEYIEDKERKKTLEVYKELCKLGGKSYYSSFEKDVLGKIPAERHNEQDACELELTRDDKDAGVVHVRVDGKWYKDYTVPVNAALARIARKAERRKVQVEGLDWKNAAGAMVGSLAGRGLSSGSILADRLGAKYGYELGDRIPDLKWFYDQVKTEGPWDIKLPEKWDETIAEGTYPGHFSTKIIYNGEVKTPEELGNYTYGYIGAALGFPLEVLVGGSVFAHVISNKMKSFVWDKIKNEFNDWPEIKKGYDAYRR
ncbi:MAG: polymorphic toxin type 44 domain-containing protein [Oscillospiraceae bacterium]|nr:polymorphic toxin type 44 domain-containing protein [Oscillospiraceae bacterium]